MTDIIRFGFVAACAAAAFYLRGDKWLLIAFLFTMSADACLLLLNWHTAGVTVFVFAQIAYVRRASGNWKALRLYPLALILPTALCLAGQPLLLCVSALYGQTLLWAVFAAAAAHKAGRMPVWRGRLACIGMVLFLGCDICVALFNLSAAGIDSPALSAAAGALIWVFYAPSQALLALSAKNR